VLVLLDVRRQMLELLVLRVLTSVAFAVVVVIGIVRAMLVSPAVDLMCPIAIAGCEPVH